MPVLGRVVTAMATPFTPDGGLDLDGAQRLATHLVDHGTDTVLVVGTTGESPTLHGDEPWELLAAVREAVADRAKVMVGTGTNDTARTVAATERATELGADAILVVTPYYNKPSQQGLYEHFTAAAAATDRPVMVYDIPGRSSREVELATHLRLAEVDNLIGVKDALGDLVRVSELVTAVADAPGGYEVYSGVDELNLPMLAVGAVGVVSVASHVAGDLVAEMIRLYETAPAKARQLHHDLVPIVKALFAEPSPAPLKGALARLGLPAGPVRLPLVAAGDDTVEAVLAALDAAGIPRP